MSKPFFQCLYVVLALMWTVSCTKPEDVDLNPPVDPDLVGNKLFVDTLHGDVFRTLPGGPVRSDEFSNVFLGTYHDPGFGTTQAIYVTQFRLPENARDLSGVSDFTQITLQIPYKKAPASYGELTTTQTFEVYELQEDISIADTFYSNSSVMLKPQKIGEWTGTPDIDAGFLTIELNQAFEDKLLNATEAQFINRNEFQEFFKGLAVVPVDAFSGNRKGAILYLSATGATVNIRYDTVEYGFVTLKDESARLNFFNHDYTNSIVGGIINNQADSGRIYAQPMGGTKTNLRLPQLRDLAAMKGKIAVRDARLTLIADGDYYPYAPPGVLALSASDIDFKDHLIRDFVMQRNVGGSYDSSANSYTFDVTLHMQWIINQYEKDPGFESYGINISVPTDNPVKANPVVITNKPGKRGVQLVLSYTKLAE